MKKYFMMTIFLFFFQCGLPDSDALNPMNPPMNLKVVANCTGTTLNGVDVSFYGFNSEEAFSGYNIYLLKSASPWTYDLASLDVKNHILVSGQSRTFNATIENNEILKNSANGLPSIPVNDISGLAYRTQPTLIKKTFKYTPIGSPDAGGPFVSNSNIYYFFVATAISLSTRIETMPSDVYPQTLVSVTYCP